jgi:gas vesicle protein
MSRVIKFLSGAILGGILGAMVAILLAPASGTELCKRITNNIDIMRNEISQAAKLRRSELEEEISKLRQSRVK